MLKNARRLLAVVAPVVLAAACATHREAPPPVVSIPPSAGIYKIGNPYQIDGTWYYPREEPDYDETGIASWYGPTFHGKRTANGEVFDSTAVTAAHRTLPMPVNVRVTNLDNGRSIVVRVNDRGPYARGRIIDLSARAAQLLGFYGVGTAKVRVTYVSRAPLLNGTMPSGPPDEVADTLPPVPKGDVQMASLDPVPGIASESPHAFAKVPPTQQVASDQPIIVQPNGQVTTQNQQVTKVPVPAVNRIYVQAGTFSILANAERLKARLASAGDLVISPIDRGGKRLYRVRIGPFNDVSAADAALSRVLALGDSDARIVVDQ
ncbi:MAG: septal ring lytic transglycosylase RlpA family protein [Rhizomicrobium sp.]|jgi:rare lipoprotein A